MFKHHFELVYCFQYANMLLWLEVNIIILFGAYDKLNIHLSNINRLNHNVTIVVFDE